MSLRERNGHWSVVVSEWVHGVRHQRVIPAGPTRADAVALEARLKAERVLQRPVHASNQTVEQYARAWLARLDVRARTQALYRHHVEHYLIPVLGPTLLRDLDTAQVERFKAAWRGLGPQTQRHLYTRLSQVCRDAVRHGALHRNPCELVDPPRVPKRELQPLRQDAAATVLATLPDDDRGLLIGMALLTGMRRSEVLGLQWADLDLAARTVTVQRGVHLARGTGVLVEPPKRASSRRRLALPEEAVALLRRRVPAGPWVFGGAEPPDPDRLGATANRWLKRHGITLHGLRHTQATLLIAAGVPVKVVSERLGHASIGITLDLYTHTAPEQDREAADALSGVLGKKKAPRLTSRA